MRTAGSGATPPETLAGLLGPPSHRKAEVAARTGQRDVALGLSLGTVAGGGVIFVEVSLMPGTGPLTLTGGLGEVMQESARVVLSWVRGNAARYGIDPRFPRGADIRRGIDHSSRSLTLGTGRSIT